MNIMNLYSKAIILSTIVIVNAQISQAREDNFNFKISPINALSYRKAKTKPHRSFNNKYNENFSSIVALLNDGYSWFYQTLNLKLVLGLGYCHNKGTSHPWKHKNNQNVNNKITFSHFISELDFTLGWTF